MVNKGGGEGEGLKEGGHINFLPLKKEGLLRREGLTEDIQ